MQNWNWEGPDSNLETSLMECGLVWCKNEECEEGQLFFVYRVGENAFGTTYHSEADAVKLAKGEDWANAEQIKDFADSMDIDINQWIESIPHGQKVFDLVLYWGVENILGPAYWAAPLDHFEFHKTHPIF